MMTQPSFSTQVVNVTETVDRILSSGKITRMDQRVFMAALLSEGSLTDQEQIQINWVFEGLRRGALRVVD